MAYTPELSEESSRTLRRIAWAIDKPMTTTMELIFRNLPGIMDKEWVCERCRIPLNCSECTFNPQGGNHAANDHISKSSRQDR